MDAPQLPAGSPQPGPPVGQATPVPPGKGEPPLLSPLPPPSQRAPSVEGLSIFDLPMTEQRSVETKDLLQDKLILAAPRMTVSGRQVPALGGIPLLAKLGQGGMGAVYFGIHPRLQKEVAVKVLPFHLVETQPDLLQRFFREARIASRVASPHVVSVLDVNEDNGLFFLVMEYVSGVSAGSYLKKIRALGRRGLEETVALEICAAAAEGLAAAHAEGVVHRDVKPDNVLIPKAKDGERLLFVSAKLADLGLARGEDINQSLTVTHAAMGTPGYMAPEQALDAHSAGVPADIFSLGATLYALLSGQAPFTGTSVTKIIFDTVQGQNAPLEQFRPDVSGPTRAIVQRCLNKDPALRPTSSKILAEALTACRLALGEPAETVRGLVPGHTGAYTAVPATTIPPSPASTKTPSAPHPLATPPAPVALPVPVAQPPSAVRPVTAPSAPAPVAAPSVATPAVRVEPKRGGVGKLLAAAVVLAVLGAGGWFGWNYYQQHQRELAREAAAEDIRREVKEARRLAGETGGLARAIGLLENLEARYRHDSEADLGEARTLLSNSKQRQAQLELNTAASGVDLQAAAFDKLDAALKKLEQAKQKQGGVADLDFTKYDLAHKALTERRDLLDQRKKTFENAMLSAQTQAATNPALALQALEDAEKAGAPDLALNLPDLRAGLAPSLSERRVAAKAKLDELERVKKEDEQRRAEADKRQQFGKNFTFARQAFVNKDVALAEKTLTSALGDLGALDHADKKDAQDLLSVIEKEQGKRTVFANNKERGEALLKEGRFAEAQAALERARDAWPEAPQAQAELLKERLDEAKKGLAAQSLQNALDAGRAHLAKQEWEEAEKHYQLVLDSRDKHPDALRGLSDARYGLAMKEGNAYLAQAEWTKAVQAFSRALKERVEDPVALKAATEARYSSALQEARDAERSAAWLKAKAAYERALREKPGDTTALKGSEAVSKNLSSGAYHEHLKEGKRLLAAGQTATAAAAFKKALEYVPDGREALEGLAAASGTRVALDAKTEWKDSGVKVKTGDKVKLAVTGEWKAWHFGNKVNASGKNGTPTGRVLNRDDSGHEFFRETLIARISGPAEPPKRVGLFAAKAPLGPPPFYIGTGVEFVAKEDGTLQFRMNEEDAMAANPLLDNVGQLDIAIQVFPASLQKAEPAPQPPAVHVQPVAQPAVPAPAPAIAGDSGPAQVLGTFGVYSNRPGQAVPLGKDGKLHPLRTDLDKQQYEEALKEVRSYLTIEKGTRVRIEAEGTWHSGPTGDWVSPGGIHQSGKAAIKQYRAFQGSDNSFNIAMLVVYVCDKDKPGSSDFAEIAKAGHYWGYKDQALEFVMPVTGKLRFQQNRDGYYDVTQGALAVTVTVSKPK